MAVLAATGPLLGAQLLRFTQVVLASVPLLR